MTEKNKKPDIRFNSFSDEWEERKVKDICSISTGKSNTQDKIVDGIYPFYVRSPIIERSNRYLYDEESVLTVGDGVGTGKVFHYVNGKYDLHQRVYRMFDFNNGVLGKYFYYYFSNHFYDRVMAMTAKTSVDSVRYDMIAEMDIEFPKKSEQIEITRVLQSLDNLITLKQRKYGKLKNVKKAMLEKMFPKAGADVPEIRFKGFEGAWEEIKLSEVCTLFTDGDWIESKDQSDNGIRLLQTGNIGVNQFIDKPDKSKWVSENTFLNLNCTEVLPGDILISRLPEPAGRACIIPKVNEKAITAVDCSIVRTSKKCESKYLVQYLSTESYFKIVNNLLAGGTRQRISRNNLGNLIIPIPSIPEQEKIGLLLKEIDNLITLHRNELEKLKNIKKACLEKMFV